MVKKGKSVLGLVLDYSKKGGANALFFMVLAAFVFMFLVLSTTADRTTDFGNGIDFLNITENEPSIINITINNSNDDIGADNITQVNITLPAGLYLVDGSNTSTSTAVANFTNTSTLLSWQNFSDEAYMINATTNNTEFTFKVIADAPGFYNISVMVYNITTARNANFTVEVHSRVTEDGADNAKVNEDLVNGTIINITINNSDTDQSSNISTVNITLPGSFTFVNGTDQVSLGDPTANVTNASFTSTGNVMSWANFTGAGHLINASTNVSVFTFNVTANNPGLFNVTVNIYNRTGLKASRNVSIHVLAAPPATVAADGSDNITIDEENVTVDNNIFLNFSINNSYDDLGADNITQVNVTLPANFTFVTDSNLTSSTTVANFTSAGSVIQWQNLSDEAYVINATTNDTTFGFNVTADVPGIYNLTIRIYNTTTMTTKRLNVQVIDTQKPTDFETPHVVLGNFSGIQQVNFSFTEEGVINTVLFNISNSTLGVANATYTASNYTKNQWNYTIDTSEWADGVYSITAFANDSEGNFNGSREGSFNVTFDNTPPTGSYTCSPSSLNVGDTTTCTCSGSDAQTEVNSTTLTVNPSTTDTGTHTITCTLQDAAGNSVGIDGTYTVELGSSGSTSSSSGGSTSSSPSASSTESVGTVASGGTKNVDISNKKSGVDKISLVVKEEVPNVLVTVDQYDNRPSAVSKDKAGKVYRYLDIKVPSAEGKLEKAEVTIMVSKSWAGANKVAKEDIAMFKFTDEDWKQLPTTFDSETNNEYKFVAETGSFSFFAIGEKKGEDTITADGNIIPGEGTQSDTTPPPSTGGEKSGSLWWLWTLLIVIVVIVVIIVVMRMQKR